MNEIELLRAQLAAERRRVREVASACAAANRGAPPVPTGAAPAAWHLACTEYLGCVLRWFDERDARLAALDARFPAGEALERLAGAGTRHRGWQDFAQFIHGPWDTRRATVEALLATNPRVADWRAFAGIDADSILRERALHASCRAALPAETAPGSA